MKRVGVLAVQGDFARHAESLALAGAEAVEVRNAKDLESVNGLVLPGGESTTMLKLLHANEMWEPLRRFCQEKPVFGTCAGAILLAKVVRSPQQESLQIMDLAVERNAYGRQLDSRITKLPLDSFEGGDFEAVFIRAPIIREIGPSVRVLAEYQGDPVLVQQGKHMVATFHPELTADKRLHEYFLTQVEGE